MKPFCALVSRPAVTSVVSTCSGVVRRSSPDALIFPSPNGLSGIDATSEPAEAWPRWRIG
jgi:hypothetical protein